MKKLILIFGLLLAIPFATLQAQNHKINTKGDALIVAIEKQNISEIKKLINEGADVNYQQDVEGKKQTPLICASDGGTPEIVDILLKAGADPNKTGPVRRDTPLMYAAYNKTHAIEIAELLLQAGASPNQTGSEGLTALIWAVNEGRTELVERLLKAGADVNSRGIFTALHAAVQFSTKEMVTLLLKNGANLNRLDAAGNTPLDYAYREKNTEMVEFLLAKGAKIAEAAGDDDDEYYEYDEEYYESDYEELVCECIEKKFSEATQRFINRICSNSDISAEEIDTFIKEGANINAAFKIGYEGADYSEGDYREISRPVLFLYGDALRHLIAKGAKINVTDNDGNTLLMRQLLYGDNIDIIKLLLEKKANPNEGSVSRRIQEPYEPDLDLTPLEYAVFAKQTTIAELLIKHGAEVKNTRAHFIAADKADGEFHGKKEHDNEEADALWAIVRTLLEKGADINAQNHDFRESTLLGYAIAQQRLDMVQYLVEHGANIMLKDYDYDYAYKARQYQNFPNGVAVKEYIYSLTETFDNEAREKSGYLPIHGAITERDLKKVTAILKANPSAAKALDNNGNTTLHVLFYSHDIEGSVDDYGLSGFLSEITIMATEEDMMPMFELLLANGANANAVNKNNKTPLHAASEYGAPNNFISALLARAADVNAKDKFGKTPLHYAYTAEIAEILIAGGADVHAVSTVLQRTPLHLAAQRHNPSLITVLLNAGADKNAKDKYGNTPFDLLEYSDAETLDALNKEALNEMMGALKPDDKSMLKYILLAIAGLLALTVAVVVVKKRKK